MSSALRNLTVSSKSLHNSTELSALYDKYAPAIYGCICKEISNEKIAADILKEVFVRYNSEMQVKMLKPNEAFLSLYRIFYKLICERLTSAPKKDILSIFGPAVRSIGKHPVIAVNNR